MTLLVIFSLLMSMVSMGRGINRGSNKFEYITGMIFSVIFFLLAVFIWLGGSNV